MKNKNILYILISITIISGAILIGDTIKLNSLKKEYLSDNHYKSNYYLEETDKEELKEYIKTGDLKKESIVNIHSDEEDFIQKAQPINQYIILESGAIIEFTR